MLNGLRNLLARTGTWQQTRPEQPPQRGENCLVIVSPRIGDVIFSTPAIHLLKEQIAPGKIEVVALSTAAASVFENNPDVERVWLQPSGRELADIGRTVSYTLDFHANKHSTHVARLVGRPLYQSCRTQPGIHQSQVATNFIRNLFAAPPEQPDPGYRLHHTPLHETRARAILQASGATLAADEILIGCHPGTYTYALRAARLFKRQRYSSKSWPPENFLRLAELLFATNPNVRLVLTGSAAETALAKPFMRWPERIVNLMGKTSVLELKACMLHFRAFVVADTGPLHVASSTTCPIIYLSSNATCASNTGPYPEKPWHYPVHRNTMEDIHPEDVLRQLNATLQALYAAGDKP